MNRGEFLNTSTRCFRFFVAREVCRMPESFGARLRQQRERQQIALTSIAEQTKIGLSLLEALERDDLSHWPAGIFRRSFIRAYARSIGLEPDVVVRELLELHPDPVDVVSAASAVPSDVNGASVSARPPTRLQYLVDSAIGSLSRLGIGFVPGPRETPLDGVTTADPSLVTADASSVTADPGSVTVDPGSVTAPALPEPDLLAAAHLCTELGCICETSEAEPLLQGAARILDAVGLIVWVWDPQRAELRPVLAHGYPDQVLAQLPRVRRDADNATAAAFRSAQTCTVNGNHLASGAVVVPLMTPVGCVGALAVELPHGREQRESVRALATIFAAQLAMLVGNARLAQAVNA
jgi:GAF domain-containing protein